MTNQELEKKIAQLESVNDQMYSELCYLDRLMRIVGFTNGLATVKETARELNNNHTPEQEEESL